jgi:hypothetical protein
MQHRRLRWHIPTGLCSDRATILGGWLTAVLAGVIQAVDVKTQSAPMRNTRGKFLSGICTK